MSASFLFLRFIFIVVLSSPPFFVFGAMPSRPLPNMHLQYYQLEQSLVRAHYEARRDKTSTPGVIAFEQSFSEGIHTLTDALWTRQYQPLPSRCFIVEHPKLREVFAAQYPDRIVHHQYYDMAAPMFETDFIRDSYSCIQGRGTLDGILRLTHHIRSASHNWIRPCYAMKLDIRGYFMHIHRPTLLRIVLATIDRLAAHHVPRWRDILDLDYLRWLTAEIALLDPKDSCIRTGDLSRWQRLDPAKSLFCTKENCGLPIGNLTSQLFSNVYLNPLDQFAKRTLRCRHYGRYVDDAYIISPDRQWLLSLVPAIREFLHDELRLDLHMGKLQITTVQQGVEFLGAYARPFRTYVSRRTVERIIRQMQHLDFANPARVAATVNSWLGIMRHCASYHLRRELFFRPAFLQIGTFDRDMTRFTLAPAPARVAATVSAVSPAGLATTVPAPSGAVSPASLLCVPGDAIAVPNSTYILF